MGPRFALITRRSRVQITPPFSLPHSERGSHEGAIAGYGPTDLGDSDEGEQGSEAESSGVDLTLIDEMLRLSPIERLRQNDRVASLAAKLRGAFESGAARWPKR